MDGVYYFEERAKAGACKSFWFPELTCKPFAKEDIAYLVQRVGYSASLAVATGADALELHAYGGYLLGVEKPGKHVVVIGGGLVGCETAAYMAETAEDVTIVCECGAKVTEVTPESMAQGDTPV